MCLLALQCGVPAFNISYESKGVECYGYLGLERHTVDYNCDADTAAERLGDFLDSEAGIRERLPELIHAQHLRASRDLDSFLARLAL
jgi:polysaccharide pyruvyl transferase WcaK-like protein